MGGLPWGLTIGNLLEMGVFIVGAIAAIVTVRLDIKILHKAVDEMEVHNREVLKEFRKLETNMADQILEGERTIGESIGAIREKIAQVELYMRDNFLRREALSEIKQDIRVLGDKLEARLLRMESGINIKQQR